MRISTKLTLLFLVTSLTSLLSFGLIALIITTQTIEQDKLQELTALADVQERQLAEIIKRGSEVQELEIEALVQSYTGTRETGEMTVAKRNEAGDAEFLHLRRFENVETTHATISKERSDIPITQALRGNEGVFRDVVDYREEPVLAVTRYIEDGDLGLVLKVDKTEAFMPVRVLATLFLGVGIVLLMLTLLISRTLARTLSRPIEELQASTSKIAEGDLKHRIDVKRRDEIGALADAFNQMTKQVQPSRRGLERTVAKRTRELNKAKTSLEAEVQKRTKELSSQLSEVERMNKAMVNRELKMVELKEELQQLKKQKKKPSK